MSDTREHLFGEGLEASPMLDAIAELLNGDKRAPTADWYAGEHMSAYQADRHRLSRTRAQLRRLLESYDFVNILNLAWSHTSPTNRELLKTNLMWLEQDGNERFNQLKYTMIRGLIDMSLYMAAEDWPADTFPRQLWPVTLDQIQALTKRADAEAKL